MLIEPDWRDEFGRSYGTVIAHNTLTPVPVMGDLGAFEPVDPDGAMLFAPEAGRRAA